MIDIIIVDDEKIIREGISSRIDWKANGINVCALASDGTQALDLIEQYMPSIVITDISMRDLDGLELLEIVNQVYPNIKVILISGYKDFEYAQKAIALNAFHYMTKPVDTTKLVNVVLQAKTEIDKKRSEIKINDNIRKKLRENLLIIKDNFFSNLLLGKIRNVTEIREQADMIEVNFNVKQYIVCILEFEENNTMQKKNIYDQSFYKAAIMSSVENEIDEIYNSYTFNMLSRIGLIVCADNINKDFLKKKLKGVINWVNKEMGMILTIGVGSTCGDIEKISLSYRAANDAIQYRVVLGKNVIIDSQHKYETTKEIIAIEDFDSILKNNESNIIYAIKNDETKVIEDITKEIMDSMKMVVTGDIKLKEREIFLLTFYLIKIIYALEIYNHKYYGSENNLFKKLNAVNSLDEINIFLKSFFFSIVKEMNIKKKSRNNFLVDKAVKFVQDNIYDSISLVIVADKLQIHPNYLSKIFKNETKTPFTTFVIETKMKEAKKLLKDTNLKVYEIADKMSYKDVAHFTRLFKKSFGVSPTEYRQLL